MIMPRIIQEARARNPTLPSLPISRGAEDPTLETKVRDSGASSPEGAADLARKWREDSISEKNPIRQS